MQHTGLWKISVEHLNEYLNAGEKHGPKTRRSVLFI